MVRSLGAMDRWIGRSDRYRIVRSVWAMDLLIGRSVDQIDKIVKISGKNESEDRIDRIVTLVGAKKRDGLVDRIDRSGWVGGSVNWGSLARSINRCRSIDRWVSVNRFQDVDGNVDWIDRLVDHIDSSRWSLKGRWISKRNGRPGQWIYTEIHQFQAFG